jgi:hypothetical protein
MNARKPTARPWAFYCAPRVQFRRFRFTHPPKETDNLNEPTVSQINPFTGAILQAPHVQRSQATDRDRQLRRATDLSKNAALAGEQLQHEVESSEAITPAHEDQAKNPKQRKKPDPQQSAPGNDDADNDHLDLTA